MHRYFFDIDDGTGAIRDSEGSDHPDLDDAEREAVETLGQMARDARTRGDRLMRVDIRDAMGRHLLRLTLKLTIEAL